MREFFTNSDGWGDSSFLSMEEWDEMIFESGSVWRDWYREEAGKYDEENQYDENADEFPDFDEWVTAQKNEVLKRVDVSEYVEWDEDDKKFIFPDWLNDGERAEYATLAEYNIAYDSDVTDVDDDGYLIYAKMRRMIDDGDTRLRLKNAGPYNPDEKKIILLKIGGFDHDWRRVEFTENNDTYSMCRSLDIEYPLSWKIKRETRLKNRAYDWPRKIAPTLPGLKSAHEETVRKIAELERERDRLNAEIEQQQAAFDEANVRAQEWLKNELSK